MALEGNRTDLKTRSHCVKRELMDLYLIRHAQSENNANPDSQRVPDPALTEIGREQARRLADHVASLRLTKLITSPFLRTLQTADAIFRKTGLAPEVRTQLHELGGCYSGFLPAARIGQPGMTRSEVENRFPGFRIEPELNGEGWWRSQSHESLPQARLRAEALLHQTRREFADSSERVGYVMHADIKLLLLENFHCDPLAVPLNTSFTRVSISPEEIRLCEYNRVDHLPDHLVTI